MVRMNKTEQPGKTEWPIAIVLVDESTPALSRVGGLLGQMADGRIRPMPVVTLVKGASAGKSTDVMRPLGPLVIR